MTRAGREPVAGHVEQVMPTVRPDRVSVHELAAADAAGLGESGEVVAGLLAERLRVGVARYGAPLTAGNGRNTWRDACEEALDLAVYLRVLIEEGEEWLRHRYLRALQLAALLAATAAARGAAWWPVDGPGSREVAR